MTANGDRFEHKDAVAFGTILLAAIGTAWLIRCFYIPGNLILWDEAHHLSWAFKISEALRAGRWADFVKICFDQFQYPPLHSIALGAFLVPFEFSFSLARTVHLFWFIVTALLLFGIGRNVVDDRKTGTGFFSATLFLISPLMLYFFGTCMVEPMSTALTCLTTYSYLKNRSKGISGALVTSICLTALTFTKYNHGILIALAILTNESIVLIGSKNRFRDFHQTCWMLIPFSSVFLIWLTFPKPRITEFLLIMQNPFDYLKGVGTQLERLSYYPMSLLFLYTPSVWIGVAVLGALVGTVVFLKDPKVRFLWLAFVINLGLGTHMSHNLQERYIMTTVPLLLVLCVVFWNRVASLLILRVRRWRPACVLILAPVIVLIGIDLTKLPSFVYAAGAYTVRSPVFGQIDYEDRIFDYHTTKWPHQMPITGFIKPEKILIRVAEPLDLRKPIQVIGYANEFSPGLQELTFELRKKRYPAVSSPFSRYTIVLTLNPLSRFYTRDYRIENASQMILADQILGNPGWRLIQDQEYPLMGIRVRSYGKID